MKWKTNGTQPVCTSADSPLKVNVSPLVSPWVSADVFGVSPAPFNSQTNSLNLPVSVTRLAKTFEILNLFHLWLNFEDHHKLEAESSHKLHIFSDFEPQTAEIMMTTPWV